MPSSPSPGNSAPTSSRCRRGSSVRGVEEGGGGGSRAAAAVERRRAESRGSDSPTTRTVHAVLEPPGRGGDAQERWGGHRFRPALAALRTAAQATGQCGVVGGGAGGQGWPGRGCLCRPGRLAAHFARLPRPPAAELPRATILPRFPAGSPCSTSPPHAAAASLAAGRSPSARPLHLRSPRAARGTAGACVERPVMRASTPSCPCLAAARARRRRRSPAARLPLTAARRLRPCRHVGAGAGERLRGGAPPERAAHPRRGPQVGGGAGADRRGAGPPAPLPRRRLRRPQPGAGAPGGAAGARARALVALGRARRRMRAVAAGRRAAAHRPLLLARPLPRAVRGCDAGAQDGGGAGG